MSVKKRKIFFSSTVGDNLIHKVVEEQKYILKALISHGTIINAAHYLPDNNVDTSDEAFSRSIETLDQAQVLIAEVSQPSHGVGREIAYAQYVRKIPVLCIYKRGEKPSAMLEGNEDIQVFPYETTDDVKGIVDNYFTHRIE